MYWSLARCWWLGASTSLLAACWQGGATGENGSSGTEGGATATATATATAPTDASGGPGDSGDSGETGGGAALDCDGPVKVGPNALRRLTRKQYHNTVRDLLGLDPPTDGFVSDKKVGPFATNSTAPVGELEVEKYMDAAEAVAIAATADLTGRLPCDPAGQEDACADQFIAEFGRRAFRRPLLADERDTLRGLYELGATQGFAAGIGLVIQGALQSPNFSELVLWADGDADRRSSGLELQSLHALGLVSIELGYASDRRCDARANCEVERASFVWRDGLGRERTGEVIDVHLACQ